MDRFGGLALSKESSSSEASDIQDCYFSKGIPFMS